VEEGIMIGLISGHNRTWFIASVIASSAALIGVTPMPLWAQGDASKHGEAVRPKQVIGHPDPSLLPLWAVLEGQAKSKVTVFWHLQWGTPETIYGVLSEALSPSEASARRFLADHAQLFKLDPTLQDLTLAQEKSSLLGPQFVFAQHHRGVPVHDGIIKVMFDKGGRIIAINNSYVPLAQSVEAVPAITPGEALAAGRRNIEQLHGAIQSADEAPAPIANLVIYAEEGTPTLAWQVIHHSWGPTWEMFLDAKTGGTLKSATDINRYGPTQTYTTTGKGNLFVTNAVVAAGNPNLRDNKDASSLLDISNNTLVIPTYQMNVALQKLRGNGYLDGQWASSRASKKRVYSSNNQFLFDRSSNGFSETMGYYYITLAQQRIQDLGFTNINNRQQIFSIDRFTKDNSYYSVSTKEITFGTGGVDDSEDAELIWHEYGHAIQDAIVEGFGTTAESGAMGEGFGDYWSGTLGDQYNTTLLGPSLIPENICLAEWDSTTYRTPATPGDPTCLRRLDGTKHYPEDMHYEVHDDGEIWSAALWQIRAAIGADRADRVILQHHIGLPKSASFNMAAHALIQTACTLNYRSDISSLSKILKDRGFDYINSNKDENPLPTKCPS
jgi:Zn-dependent metalloprotease